MAEGKYGQRFNKPDLQRNALFAEMEYLHGKRPKPPKKDGLYQGKQMGTDFPKIRTGLQDCYFGKEFTRIFVGEAIPKPRKKKKETGKLKERPPFFPPQTPKWHSTPGDIYGTFTKQMEAFSPRTRAVRRKKEAGPVRRNIVTKPGKKGGPGYADICISRYPEHLRDPYDAGPKRYSKNYREHMKRITKPMYPPRHTEYFDKNPFRRAENQKFRRFPKVTPPKDRGTFFPPATPKDEGGCKAGCFEKYPEHSKDKYLSPAEIAKFIPRAQRLKMKKQKPKEPKSPFYPPFCNITSNTFSIINNKADLCTNAKNWETAKTFTFPLIELQPK